jgi:hypothetical protein
MNVVRRETGGVEGGEETGRRERREDIQSLPPA